MISQYINAAMHRAVYEILPEGFYGEIPDCQGVWASADTLENCRNELQSVLEGWLIVGLSQRHPIPEIDGINLSISEVA